MRYRGTGIERTLRYLYLRFVRIRGSAHDVAKGMALGVFIGMTPTMGVQMPIAFFAAMLLKENQIAALLGVWISNPATAIPIYTFNFKVGKYLLGTPNLKMPRFTSFQEVMALGHDFLLPLATGSLVTGVVAAVVAYPVTYFVYRGILIEKEKILSLRRKRRAALEKKTKGPE